MNCYRTRNFVWKDSCVDVTVVCARSHLALDGVPDDELVEQAQFGPVLAMMHTNGVWKLLKESSEAQAKLFGEYVAYVYIA